MSFEIKNFVEVTIGNIPCIVTQVRCIPAETTTIEFQDKEGYTHQTDGPTSLIEFQITAIQKP